MFLKAKVKYIKSTGEHRLYYRLCESYRYQDTVRHHTIVEMGTLEQLPEASARKLLVDRIASLVKQNRTGQCDMFESANATIEALAQKYFAEIQHKSRLDMLKGKDYETIDTHSIENKDIREVGTEWLCA